MRAKTILQITIITIFTLMHFPSNAQHVATAVMTATVEIVSGSAVKISNTDILATEQINEKGDVYAVISITHNQSEIILTSYSNVVELSNGVIRKNIKSSVTENRESDSVLNIKFETIEAASLIDGLYTGIQITEIVYL